MPLKLYISSTPYKTNSKTLQGLYIYKYNDKKFFYIHMHRLLYPLIVLK